MLSLVGSFIIGVDGLFNSVVVLDFHGLMESWKTELRLIGAHMKI